MKTLGRLLTDLGERSTYDAASQCSRCGYCEQSCPTYVATGREDYSPRGRNQLVRLLLEGKLKDKASAKEALSTCLLCGGCQTICYAHVPTPDIVLEGRRMLEGKPPIAARALTGLLLRREKLFVFLLKFAYTLKRLGISKAAQPLLRALGLRGLAAADEHVHDVPSRLLFEMLRQRKWSDKPAWMYFGACGTNYLYPRVGLATIKALTSKEGEGGWLDAGCCGLLAYNYGDPQDARALAKRVIERSEATSAVPIVADCSSCSAFLKSYPQLFLEDSAWKERAQRFAARVRDAVEVFESAGKKVAGPTTCHESCRARHGQNLRAPKPLLESAGEFRPMAESDACCGGAGAFSLLHPDLSDEVLKRKIANIASTQAKTVVTSSTSCLLQLDAGLSKYYPSCTVMHVSELAASDGDQ